jgi:DNA polymerase-3 subunit alpha
MFSDVLDPARDWLAPGGSVVLAVEATLEGDEMKLRATAVQPVDLAVANAGAAGLRVFVDAPEAGASIAARLAVAAGAGGRARGPIQLVVMAGEIGEVEVPLPELYPITPQVVSALRHVSGVVHVEDY